MIAIGLPAHGLGAEPAEKHALKSEHQPGELTRVELRLQVGGDLKLIAESKPKNLPMSVVADLTYDEHLVSLDGDHRPARSLRYYTDAHAVIKVDKGGEKPALADDHRLIAVDKSGTAAPLLYCPREPLGREELDLIDVPGNSLLLDRMLPAEPVAQGESWKISDQALAELLGLEAVSWTDVESMLGEITEGVAIISAGGSLSGAVGGVSTDIEMKAKYKFDLARRRITYFALLIKEKRAVGHIGPGLDTVAKLIMVISPLASSRHLSAQVVEKFGAEKAGSRPALRYTAVSGQFRLDYDRRWYLTAEDPKLAIMRLLDRGELVAQCNVSALPSASKAPPSLAEFQHDIEQSLGKNFGQFVQASQDTTKSGYSVLRVVTRGVVAQLPIEWIYYLVSDKQGHRVSLAFTFEQELEERFAHADRPLINQLTILEPPSPTKAEPPAAKPTDAQRPKTSVRR